jgi:hypothetical protein
MCNGQIISQLRQEPACSTGSQQPLSEQGHAILFPSDSKRRDSRRLELADVHPSPRRTFRSRSICERGFPTVITDKSFQPNQRISPVPAKVAFSEQSNRSVPSCRGVNTNQSRSRRDIGAEDNLIVFDFLEAQTPRWLARLLH